jgi:hypothetical protein
MKNDATMKLLLPGRSDTLVRGSRWKIGSPKTIFTASRRRMNCLSLRIDIDDNLVILCPSALTHAVDNRQIRMRVPISIFRQAHSMLRREDGETGAHQEQHGSEV